MFNNQAANIKLYVALNEPHQYKPKSESRSDIVFLGSFHKIPAEKYPPKDNHHYHKKQLDDLTRLLKRVSSSQALAGRIERYEVRHPLSADVLSLCRIPKRPTGSNSEWREPRLRELEGFLQIGDIRYPYMYASTIRGIEERQRKLGMHPQSGESKSGNGSWLPPTTALSDATGRIPSITWRHFLRIASMKLFQSL